MATLTNKLVAVYKEYLKTINLKILNLEEEAGTIIQKAVEAEKAKLQGTNLKSFFKTVQFNKYRTAAKDQLDNWVELKITKQEPLEKSKEKLEEELKEEKQAKTKAKAKAKVKAKAKNKAKVKKKPNKDFKGINSIPYKSIENSGKNEPINFISQKDLKEDPKYS